MGFNGMCIACCCIECVAASAVCKNIDGDIAPPIRCWAAAFCVEVPVIRILFEAMFRPPSETDDSPPLMLFVTPPVPFAAALPPPATAVAPPTI